MEVSQNDKTNQLLTYKIRQNLEYSLLRLAFTLFTYIATSSSCFAFNISNTQADPIGNWNYKITFDMDELFGKTLSVDAQIPEGVQILSFSVSGTATRTLNNERTTRRFDTVNFAPDSSEGSGSSVSWIPSNSALNSSSTASYVFTAVGGADKTLFDCGPLAPAGCEEATATWSINPEQEAVAPSEPPSVSEPLTILGSLTALIIGASLKRKYN